MPTQEFPNPVVRTVLVRDVGPFVPVWLFGVVLAVSLDRLGLGVAPLPLGNLAAFTGAYTTLVFGLVGVRFYWDRLNCPRAISLDGDQVVGLAGSPSASGPKRIPFGSIHAISVGGLFAPRLDARPAQPDGRSHRWEVLFLTRENAVRVRDAWEEWVRRERAIALGAELADAAGF
ncbi:MAG: hypothetical protein L3K09_00110 [Thermoplasmata archaeon]|nr:hypothetical protein [Thermoplasmata archaeon]